MVGIGELLASAVVKEVCSKLAATVGKEVALQLNTAADLESMQGTLSSIQAVLVDAERRSLKEESVRLWLKKLKAAAYDIEDMLVDYEAIVPSHEAEILDGTVQKGKGWIDLLKLRYLKSRLNIPHRMKMMRERLEKIKEEADISKFHFKYGSSSGEEEVTRSRQTTSNACEDIVGRVEEKKWLMRLLLLADEPSIIPIYGLGGIGKTTLAQMVYNDKGIEKNFDLLSWVYVSKKFDLEMIGRSIISKSKESSQNDIDLELVTHHAKSSISDKKFLIVLDDLWEEDPFKLEELKTMLKGGKKGSKIIVTTRSEKVAKLINSNLQFKLDGLPDNDCWTLFKSKAFKNSTMEVNLQNMGKEIVKKCNGVPLAAKSIGFLLRDKEVTAWEAVRDSDIWEERDDGPLAEKKVLPSLKLSYYHMPSYLRLCFAYCAAFPKGSDIDKHSLINQWIALGFIQATQGNLKEEDYAEQYLKDLLEMSFLQIARICSIAERYSKPTRVLLMHDLVHDLARSIAGDEIFVVNGVNKSSRDTAISYCRYALVTNYGDPSKSCKDDLPSTARALHFRGCSKMILPRNMFASTKFLRVLDLSGCSTRDLPSSCSQLKQLKYLNCSGLQIQRLPSSMSALQNLQVLNLSYCASLDMLPTWIGSFPILRHLNLHGCSSLSELPECIGRLRNLRYLDVSACSRLQMLPISFGELENLSSLNLSGCADLQILPQSFFFLRNLTDLNLSSCCRLEQLPPLSPRHHEVHDILNALDICDSACPEKLPEFDGDLMKLERLDLANCINLREIPESYGTLSRLRFLNLSGCFKLKNILRFFANSHYTNLEYLNLSNVHKINDFTTIDNFRQGDRFVDPIEDLARDRFVDPMEDLTPSLLHEQVESHMEDLANDIFVDPKKDLTLSLLREQVGSMVHLKYLSVGGVTLFSEQGLRSLVDLMTLPAFYVSSMTQSDGINISNIFILQQILDTSHHRLYIDGIENVESPLEARRAELAKHHQLQSLELRWSRGISGDCIGGGDADINVLEELCPHQNLVDLSVTGYRGSTFIGWMADISNSLPQLTKIKLSYLPRCGLLPPLGQLPNLREVDIAHIPGIKDVGFDFYGGTQPFQRLEVLRLSHMDNLEEWATTVLQEDVTFPKLKNLIIVSCAKLRFKPFIPRSDAYDITASDKVLSFERALGHSNPMVLSTMLITGLYFDGWRGLQYITNLQVLDIKYCRNLSYLPENIQSMRSLHTLVIEECPDFKALPENIGELTSLQKLTIVGSQLKCLPQSMQHLSALKMLRLIRCDSKLGEWFFYSDNQMAISHIPDIQLDMVICFQQLHCN